MAHDFQIKNTLPKGLNSSFITLIPKVDNPKDASQYRPISLINFTMKIILKMMASRLGRVIHELVADNQTAFIKGRNIITDGILIANEVADCLLRKESRGLILNLDFAKAFDTISWSFLLDTMRSMNFKEEWISWIHTIISTAKPSILVNGSPTTELNMYRGLRQGDPLSPLLFNLVGECFIYCWTRPNKKASLEVLKLEQTVTLLICNSRTTRSSSFTMTISQLKESKSYWSFLS